ncbi:MAG: PEP-CTERM sorting domain-containing protein [Limisphaerales bacterium]
MDGWEKIYMHNPTAYRCLFKRITRICNGLRFFRMCFVTNSGDKSFFYKVVIVKAQSSRKPMKSFINQNGKLARLSLTAVGLCLGLGLIQAQAQSVDFTFSDGTSDGWDAGGFSDSTALAVENIGGQNYVVAPDGGFQVGNVASGNTGLPSGLNSAFNSAMNAALNNPSGYDFSYTWSVNTAEAGWQTGNSGGPATFLQLGIFVNTGTGYYEQDYGGNDTNEPQLNGTQMASGGIFSGTVTLPFTVFAPDSNAATETDLRLGLIVNGNGSGDAEFTDISITAVPEPATLSLCGLGLASGLMFLRRRRKAQFSGSERGRQDLTI